MLQQADRLDSAPDYLARWWEADKSLALESKAWLVRKAHLVHKAIQDSFVVAIAAAENGSKVQ
jgi:hypothetical protein